ncbi:MAG: 5-oxoprolinase subunit PxpB [Pyrinomonadaceae bacterium]
MVTSNVRFFPLGDSALTVEFSNTISTEDNQRSVALSEYFQGNPFPGFIEAVPAYASTTIFYDVATVRGRWPRVPSAFDAVKNITENVIQSLVVESENGRFVEIPICFDRNSALDLHFLAQAHGISEAEVIHIFLSTDYRVFMLGFLPGFSYMGEIDERIATPRRAVPRQSVPKGSVGIAGRQTGIYSLDSPGGWQIIGRTDQEMFTPDMNPPCYLRPGDRVRFVALQ